MVSGRPTHAPILRCPHPKATFLSTEAAITSVTLNGSAGLCFDVGGEIDTVVSLTRREGRWYLSDYLRHADEVLAAAAAAPEPPLSPPPPGPDTPPPP